MCGQVRGGQVVREMKVNPEACTCDPSTFEVEAGEPGVHSKEQKQILAPPSNQLPKPRKVSLGGGGWRASSAVMSTCS